MKKTFLLLAASTMMLSAGTVNFYSDTVNESNSTMSPNQLLANVHPAWEPNGANYSWISYAQTDGSNANVANGTVISFYETITVGGAGTGSVTVWADDTANVFFENIGIPPFQSMTLDGACHAGPVGCEPGEQTTFNFAFASAGTYQLRFDVYQLGGGPFGLMYTGSANYNDAAPTPEPASMAFAGIGLVTVGYMARRRAQKKS